MNSQDRFGELWTDYVEGELDETGVEILRELLAADSSLVKQAVDLLQTHRLLGLIAVEEPARQDQFVRETLAQLPDSQNEFVSRVMTTVENANIPPKYRNNARAFSRWGWITGALLLFAVMLFAFWPSRQTPIATDDSQPPTEVMEPSDVRLVSVAQAKFFGELSPPVGSILTLHREYVLTSGLIKVTYPQGASAILEGPAVFRIASNDSLALDVGNCSVHAPAGAEGFRVETPATRVIDRGTRFSVSVGETSETEVHVIEGAADIYEVGRGSQRSDETQKSLGGPSYERLTVGQARRFVDRGTLAMDTVDFDASVYRRELPDRVVSYEASKGDDGGAEFLKSVTVQRGGKVYRFPVEELITARVSWFNATEPRGFLCGNATLPASRADCLSDSSLVTGLINPDGNRHPLTTDPVMHGENGTPGMAVRFDRPVVNGPGADVVFFELQTFINPSEGDAFHVSPLVFRDELTSQTIRNYDLTMESTETQDLTNFYVHFLTEPIGSLSQLDEVDYSSQKQSVRFRGLVVGIDLSDLGYRDGETVEGLFFQDALDDGHRVDPVFIAGLPEIK